MWQWCGPWRQRACLGSAVPCAFRSASQVKWCLWALDMLKHLLTHTQVSSHVLGWSNSQTPCGCLVWCTGHHASYQKVKNSCFNLKCLFFFPSRSCWCSSDNLSDVAHTRDTAALTLKCVTPSGVLPLPLMVRANLPLPVPCKAFVKLCFSSAWC